MTALHVIRVHRGLSDSAGRDRMARDLDDSLAALEAAGQVRITTSVLHKRGMARGVIRWLTSGLTLPEALYGADLAPEAAAADVVLLSGWGAQTALEAARRAAPRARIVAELDDAYPDRLRAWRAIGVGYAAGMLGAFLPKRLRALLQGPLGRPLNWIEAWKGRRRMAAIARAADAVYLSGAEEADRYAAALAGICRVHHLPPAFRTRARPTTERLGRFIFVGSDQLIQNASALTEIARRWDSLRGLADLHLFSRHEAPFDRPGWLYEGFVDGVEEIFASGSVLLYPSQVTGGIKIKIVEALEWGCPIVTTPVALEGLGQSAALDGLWTDFAGLADGAPLSLPSAEALATAQDRLTQDFAARRAKALAELTPDQSAGAR